jgi:hypothetical protein
MYLAFRNKVLSDSRVSEIGFNVAGFVVSGLWLTVSFMGYGRDNSYDTTPCVMITFFLLSLLISLIIDRDNPGSFLKIVGFVGELLSRIFCFGVVIHITSGVFSLIFNDQVFGPSLDKSIVSWVVGLAFIVSLYPTRTSTVGRYI